MMARSQSKFYRSLYWVTLWKVFGLNTVWGEIEEIKQLIVCPHPPSVCGAGGTLGTNDWDSKDWKSHNRGIKSWFDLLEMPEVDTIGIKSDMQLHLFVSWGWEDNCRIGDWKAPMERRVSDDVGGFPPAWVWPKIVNPPFTSQIPHPMLRSQVAGAIIIQPQM